MNAAVFGVPPDLEAKLVGTSLDIGQSDLFLRH
jgi:hypothetical protein